MYIGENIRYLRKQFGISQPELAEKLGYKSFTTIQKWESGISTPPLEVFVRMAELFSTDLDSFARVDLSLRRKTDATHRKRDSVPVYGRIPAGIPVEEVTDIEEYVSLSESMLSSRLEFFALRLSGNSMSPKYNNNDVVIFEKQSSCESGDECAIRLNGEDVTFKKVLFEDDKVILKPLNPDYVTIQFNRNRMNSILEIIGIAKEIRRLT